VRRLLLAAIGVWAHSRGLLLGPPEGQLEALDQQQVMQLLEGAQRQLMKQQMHDSYDSMKSHDDCNRVCVGLLVNILCLLAPGGQGGVGGGEGSHVRLEFL